MRHRIAATALVAAAFMAVPTAANAATSSCGCQPVTHRQVNRVTTSMVVAPRPVNRFVGTVAPRHPLRLPAWCAAWLSH